MLGSKLNRDLILGWGFSLIRDKELTGKAGGFQTFSRNAEAYQQLILDPLCGKGSTEFACVECNRDVRLIDSHKGQFESAVENVTLAMG